MGVRLGLELWTGAWKQVGRPQQQASLAGGRVRVRFDLALLALAAGQGGVGRASGAGEMGWEDTGDRAWNGLQKTFREGNGV